MTTSPDPQAAQQSLAITFRGICTHFRNVVPGVPHRVVMPDATAIRFGVVELPDGTPVGYSLMPHVVVLTANGTSQQILGARIEVTNAVASQPLNPTAGGFPIGAFVDNFAFSEDVVTGGKAACYFDVSGGDVETFGTDSEPNFTVITIRTYGAPHVRVTPFAHSVTPAGEFDVAGGTMSVTNLDYDAAVEDKPFDFLLNYLVARGGIPRKLKQLLPGLTDIPPALAADNVAAQLITLAGKIADFPSSPASGQTPPEYLASLINPENVGDSASCSDSHYP